MTDVKITAAQQEQSKSDKKNLIDLMKGKKRKSLELPIVLNGENVTLTFNAISARELDKLRAAHPPTKAQIAQNSGVNYETFQPALVAATLADPVLTENEAREIWASDFWSSGELAQIFNAASEVCLEGLDVPPSASA